MKRALQCLTLSILITGILCGSILAQNVPNAALGKAYTISHAPNAPYLDSTGPEQFVAGKAYAGELTDGVQGTPGHRGNEWIGWRNSTYSPLVITLDLTEPTFVSRIEITATGGGAQIVPPDRIDVSVWTDFPYEAPVQVAQLVPDAAYEPGVDRIYTLAGDLGLRISKVMLTVHYPAWNYMFLDEIRLLGGSDQPGKPMPVQDVLIEAESGQLSQCTVVDVEGAANQAVLLGSGDAVNFEMPLPVGDYIVQVRSRAVEQDTFNELVPSANGEALRGQPVTNAIFTRQTSLFTQPQDGNATISLQLAEGSGVYIDQLRVRQLRLNQPIPALRQYENDTRLVADGACKCVVVYGDSGQYRAIAETVAAAIAKRGGVKPEIIGADAFTDKAFGEQHVIALGDRASNMAIMRAAPNDWSSIPNPPEEGPQIYVAVDTRGAGTNAVILGGSTVSQVQESIAAFTAKLQGDRNVTLPYMQLPTPDLTTDRETYKQVAIDSGTWLRQTALRTLFNRWKAYTDDIFIMLGYKYIEYLDSADTIKRDTSLGFIEAELFKILGTYDRREHHGTIGELDRLMLVNTLWKMSEVCAARFDWNCAFKDGKKGHYPHDEIAGLLQAGGVKIANNHQTFPMFSILTAGNYFAKYYDMEKAKDWLEWCDIFMRGQMQTSKPQCDCWGYQSITMTHTARYAAVTGRWNYFDSDPLMHFLRLLYISYDNLGAPVGYGDVGGYSAPTGIDALTASAASWQRTSGNRVDTSRIAGDDVLGLYVHSMEPLWYDYYGTGSPVPLEKSFDKITYRDELTPDRAYLLIDGISKGYHGHWDGNSILRFTDEERMWLCEGDYLKQDPKDHNTMTFMRNGESSKPGMLSSLESQFEAPQWAATRTRTPDYCGLDWDRNIIWQRQDDVFFVVDKMTAHEAGAYDMTRRFRSLGETSLENGVWTVEQMGGKKMFMHADQNAALSEATVPEDAKNWKNYQFAEDKTPKVLREKLVRELAEGEDAQLINVFYADTPDESGICERRIAVRRLSDAAIITDGGKTHTIVGIDQLRGPVRVRAEQYAISANCIMLVNGVGAATDRVLLQADKPLSLCIDLADRQTGIIEATEPTVLLIAAGKDSVSTDGHEVTARIGDMTQIELSPGRHTIKGDFTAMAKALEQATSAAWNTASDERIAAETRPDRDIRETFSATLPAKISAITAADLNGDGTAEYVAGDENGTIVAINAHGDEIWRKTMGAKINAIAAIDINGDKQDEISIGVENSHLYLLDSNGSEIWQKFFEANRSRGGIEGHPRVIVIADFEGDGTPEIGVGCANSMFYVLDTKGNIKSSNGREWTEMTLHKASAINAADITGDGQLELLCSFTYFGRRIVDFTDTGRSRSTNLPGCISGGDSVTAADVNGDGINEAIFADRDGTLTACTKAAASSSAAQVIWQKAIGDDALVKAVAGDLNGDGRPEIALASHSGFLAVVDADGEVIWARYAQNQVTDVASYKAADGTWRIVRSSLDGSVVVYDVAGNEVARRNTGDPLERLIIVSIDERERIVTAGGTMLRALDIQ